MASAKTDLPKIVGINQMNDVVAMRSLLKRARSALRRQTVELRQLRRQVGRFIIEGNNGGSYIELEHTLDDKGKPIEGMLHLEVGETCIVTVDQSISVAAFACILTQCKSVGFQKMLDDYLRTPNGTYGGIKLDIDPIVERNLKPKPKTKKKETVFVELFDEGETDY